jgi:hypothetical protein
VSDFFANVAARARKSQDVVQPRLPSRFEAPEPAAAVASGPVPEVMTEREILAPAQSRKPANSRAPREAAPMTAARDTGQHDESGPAAVPVTIAAPSPTRPPPDVVTPAAERVVAAGTSDVHAPAAARPEETNRAGDVEPRSQTRPEQRLAPAVEPRGRREDEARALAVDHTPRREVAREAQPGDRAPVRAHAGVREVPAVEPVVPRIAAVVPPAIQPRIVRATPARTPLAAAPRAAETTIHVSIGRIEVRATPPAIQRGRQAAPPAVMSLGAYLSARAERAR